MRISHAFILAFKDLKRSFKNTFLSVSGVAIGIFLITFMVSFGEGARKKALEEIKKFTALRILQVSSFPDFYVSFEEEEEDLSKIKPISKEVERKIRNFPEVSFVWRDYYFTENVEYSLNGKKITSSLSSFPKEIFDILKMKEDLVGGRIYQNDKEIIIEEGILKKLGFEDPQKALGKSIKIRLFKIEGEFFEKEIPESAKKYCCEKNLKIVGISKTEFLGEGENNLVDLSLAKKLISEYQKFDSQYKDESVYYLSVLVKEPKLVERVSNKIKKMGYEVYSPKEDIKMTNSFFKVANVFLAGFGVIVLSVAALGISNTMYIMVLQRKREIGILKALGARNRDILLIYLLEAVLIGIMGAFLGMFLAWICAQIFAHISTNILNAELKKLNLPFLEEEFKEPILEPYLSPYLILGVFLVAIVFSAKAALKPAWEASKIPPVEALRYE